MFVKLQAETRSDFSKSATHQLRRSGKVPAVVYGKKTESVALTVDEKQLQQILRDRPNALIDLTVPGQFRKTAVIQEVQRDSFTKKVLAVSFHQVDMNEPIKVTVHLDLRLEPQDKDLKVQMFLHELEIQCLPDQIPVSLPVDPEPLRRGKSVHVKDVQLPPGVKALNPPEEVIAALLHVAVVESA